MRTLRQLREEAGQSQSQVAKALGVSQKMVSKIEARNDPGEHWPKLAGVLGFREPYPAAPYAVCDLCGGGRGVGQVIENDQAVEFLQHRAACDNAACRAGWFNLRNRRDRETKEGA